MDIYLLETIHDDGVIDSEIFISPKNTDIVIGVDGWNDYVTLSVINFTSIFWDSVKKQDQDLLTHIGSL